MIDQEKIALAGLLVDLKLLLDRVTTELAPELRKIIELATLDESLQPILDQALALMNPGDNQASLEYGKSLESIFNKVQLFKYGEITESFLQFSLLVSTRNNQPHPFPEVAPKTSWKNHLDSLCLELEWISKHVDFDRFDQLYNQLQAFFLKFAWCIPFQQQDNSLLDHARMTSSIAVCLYQYFQKGAQNDNEPFCLIVGDMSGIQEYIFDIASIGAGGVARRLRARSFYISALTDVLSHTVAMHFNVPLGNVIMSSGGKFYVLVPNLGEMEEKTQELRREIDRWFRSELNGEIMINLAQVCFNGVQFRAGKPSNPGFGHLLTKLSQKLNRQKRLRGQGILTQSLCLSDGVKLDIWDESSFAIERDYWGHGICISCNKYPGNRPGQLCEHCESDVSIGKRLPQTQYIAYYKPGKGIGTEDELIMPFGFSVRILSRGDISHVGEPYLIYKFNDPDIHELVNLPASFRYLANHIPLGQNSDPLTFEDIAAQSEGRHLLGYLKADVDYLGMIFAQGLRRDNGGLDSASRIIALSREIDLFFSGWMQYTLSQLIDFKYFYTIFSGGDDLFLVGPWDKVADLALYIQKSFVEMVGNNPEVTISAGIMYTKDSYPISRAAIDVESVLERAKESEWFDSNNHSHKRNQLSLLGDTLAWNIVPQVFSEIQKLRTHSQNLTSAFLYNLIEYWSLYMLWRKGKKAEGLRYKPLFAYNIARNLRKGDTVIYEWADNLLQSLDGHNENLAMQHLGLIATYLLFMRRTSSKKGTTND